MHALGVLEFEQWRTLYDANDVARLHGTIRIATGTGAPPLILEASGVALPSGELTLSIIHAGGWSPLSVSSPFASLFSTPRFNGTLRTIPGVGLFAAAAVRFAEPLSLFPDMVVIGGIRASEGPMLRLNWTLPDTPGANTTVGVNLAATVRMANMPSLPISGDLRSDAASRLTALAPADLVALTEMEPSMNGIDGIDGVLASASGRRLQSGPASVPAELTALWSPLQEIAPNLQVPELDGLLELLPSGEVNLRRGLA